MLCVEKRFAAPRGLASFSVCPPFLTSSYTISGEADGIGEGVRCVFASTFNCFSLRFDSGAGEGSSVLKSNGPFYSTHHRDVDVKSATTFLRRGGTMLMIGWDEIHVT